MPMVVPSNAGQPQEPVLVPRPRVYCVNQRFPGATDNGPGDAGTPFRTISAAARIARAGDTVLVYAGVYRERVTPMFGGLPDLPLVFEAARGERVVVCGSEVWSPLWRSTPAHPRVVCGALAPFLSEEQPPTARQALRTPVPLTLGQVFVNSHLLRQVHDKDALHASPGSWLASADGRELSVHLPDDVDIAETARWEITVRDRIFAPLRVGLGHIHVRGFVFQHCANQFPSGFWHQDGTPQAGAISCRGGHHWVIENCEIRHAVSIGLDCGMEGPFPNGNYPEAVADVGYHRIARNVISDNGACGVAGAGQRGTHIIGNIIERNNCLGWTAPETGGIKLHFFYDGLVEGNLLRDNDCSGIWLDNEWYGSRVTRNLCVNNQGSGIFVEMGDGPCLIDHNIVAHTRCGDGIYLHDSSGVTLAHNLLYANAHMGIYARIVTERQARDEHGRLKEVECSRLSLRNNVFVDNYRGQICLPVPGPRCQANVSDHNLYLGGLQWQWEAAKPNGFALSHNDGRIGPHEAAERILAVAEKLGTKLGTAELEAMVESSPMTLDQWRRATGQDFNSIMPAAKSAAVVNGAVERGCITLASRALHLDINDATILRVMLCPTVALIDSDFFGTSICTSCFPGPFQNIKAGFQRFLLWPVPSC